MASQTDTADAQDRELQHADRQTVVQALAEHNYAATRTLNGDGPEFTVYVQQDQTAGGELKAILDRHGYLLVYPKPYEGDEFAFYGRCEPADWHMDEIPGVGQNVEPPKREGAKEGEEK